MSRSRRLYCQKVWLILYFHNNTTTPSTSMYLTESFLNQVPAVAFCFCLWDGRITIFIRPFSFEGEFCILRRLALGTRDYSWIERSSEPVQYRFYDRPIGLLYYYARPDNLQSLQRKALREREVREALGAQFWIRYCTFRIPVPLPTFLLAFENCLRLLRIKYQLIIQRNTTSFK